MQSLHFTITEAGFSELANPSRIGPIVLEKIAFGSSGYQPDRNQKKLVAPIKELLPEGSSVVSECTIHLTASDYSSDSYEVREIGLLTSTGILFAIYAQPTPILIKTEEVVAMIALDFVLSDVAPENVIIGNAEFQYPPASESTKGVAQIATQEEVDAGTDDERMVTPRKLAYRLGAGGTAYVLKAGDTMTGTLNMKRNAILDCPTTVKAWVHFDPSDKCKIWASYNISSIIDLGRLSTGGDDSMGARVNFLRPLASANYAVIASAQIGNNSPYEDQAAAPVSRSRMTPRSVDIGIKDMANWQYVESAQIVCLLVLGN